MERIIGVLSCLACSLLLLPSTVRASDCDARLGLSKMKYMAVTSDRLQDSSYEVPRHIVALGRSAVPLLIECITNETKTKRPVFDFWFETRVGDLAFYFLSDLFRDSSLDHHTVDGVITGAEIHREFPDDMSEAAFRQYVTKYGRRHIQLVWEKKWVEIKDKVYWDTTERCFKTRRPQ